MDQYEKDYYKIWGEMPPSKASLTEGYDEMCLIAGGLPLPFSVCTTRKWLIAAKLVSTPQEASRIAALQYAVHDGNIGLLKKFLSEGADPDTEVDDHTLLDIAFSSTTGKTCVELVRELLKARADPNKRSRERSPLFIAVERGLVAAAKLLLDAGADINRAGQGSISLMQTAITMGHTEAVELKLVKLLLDNGMDVNVTSDIHDRKSVERITALMLAASQGQDKVVKLLLKAGADPKMLDSERKSAVDYAAGNVTFHCGPSWNAAEIIKILTAAGAPAAQLAGPLVLPAPPPPTPDFRKAARSENFRKVLKELTKITGVKPMPLESIPGGKVYVLTDALSDEKPKTLAAELHEKMLALGCYVCYSRDIESEDFTGNSIVALPTTDVYEVISAIGTHGGDSDCDTDKIIEWLRKLEKYQPFKLTAIGPDFLEGKFTTPITNPKELAERIDEFCHDIVSQGVGTVDELANELCKSPRIFFWWD